jgi:2-iminobutanoate/2-iminopropanoate deaminase
MRDPAQAGSFSFVGTLRVSPHRSFKLPKTVPETPSAPKSLAPYSIATEAGGLVFLSGQVGIDPSTGGSSDEVVAQAGQVMSNIGAILGDLGLGYDDIVKTTIFLADIDDFATVNEVYASFFEREYPARTTVQAGALPAGFLVEIEVVAAR